MTHQAPFQLRPYDLDRAESLVTPAIEFCETHHFPLGSALIHYLWQDGPAAPVLDALATYQNPDGGFAHELEVDIKSPVSNPFAARLAMDIMLSLGEKAEGNVVDKLGTWLKSNQHADGDWHFAAEVYDSPLPFWFAGWTFPSLNPACCLTRLAARLNLANPEMLRRTVLLFEKRASLAGAENGQFYEVLPYVEYVPWLQPANADAYLQAIARGVTRTAESGGYGDASHFFDHVLPGGLALSASIPDDLMVSQSTRLIDEVLADGGWPTPYDQDWRPHATMHAMATLARLRDGV